jgi:hypothetical protein
MAIEERRVDLIIENIQANRNTLHTDDGMVRTFPMSLSIKYTVILNGHESDGSIVIREGDQDTHDSLDKLTLDDLRNIIAVRLGMLSPPIKQPDYEWNPFE